MILDIDRKHNYLFDKNVRTWNVQTFNVVWNWVKRIASAHFRLFMHAYEMKILLKDYRPDRTFGSVWKNQNKQEYYILRLVLLIINNKTVFVDWQIITKKKTFDVKRTMQTKNIPFPKEGPFFNKFAVFIVLVSHWFQLRKNDCLPKSDIEWLLFLVYF